METGSFFNHLYSRMTVGEPTPIEGLGVTLLAWTDRHAGTVESVEQLGRIIKVRRDIERRVDSNGMSDAQTYEYERDPAGALYTFRKTAKGPWEEVRVNQTTGRLNKVEGGYGLRLGERLAYHDFSF